MSDAPSRFAHYDRTGAICAPFSSPVSFDAVKVPIV